jgi:hypothetical protein
MTMIQIRIRRNNPVRLLMRVDLLVQMIFVRTNLDRYTDSNVDNMPTVYPGLHRDPGHEVMEELRSLLTYYLS